MFPLMFINDVQFLSISRNTGRHLKVNQKGAHLIIVDQGATSYYTISLTTRMNIYAAGNCYVRYMNDYGEMFDMCCAVGQLGENKRTK